MDFEFGLSIEGDTSRYHHHNSMRISSEAFINLEPSYIDEVSDEEKSLNSIHENSNYFDDFIIEFDRYVSETSIEIESLAYSFLDKINYENNIVYSKKIGNVSVIVTEIPQDVEDIFMFDDLETNQSIVTTCNELATGNCKYTALQVEIKVNEEIVGNSSLHGIHCEINDKSFGGYKRDLIINAFFAARKSLKEQRLSVA